MQMGMQNNQEIMMMLKDLKNNKLDKDKYNGLEKRLGDLSKQVDDILQSLLS